MQETENRVIQVDQCPELELNHDKKCSTAVRVTCFVVLLGIYFISFFHRTAIPGTIFNQLQTDFAATASQVSFLGAIFLYIYAVMQIFAGILVDRVGFVKIVLFAVAAMSIGAFGFSWVTSLNQLYIFRALIALGASLIFLSLIRAIGYLFSDRNFTIFLSITLIAGYMGGLAGTYPFERASFHFGWRTAIAGVGVFSLIMFSAFVITVLRFRRETGKGSAMSFADISKVLKNNHTFPLYIANCIPFSVYFVMQSSLGKKMLEDTMMFSSEKAASHIFLLILVAMIGVGLSGFVSRCIGNRRKPLIVVSSLMALLFSLLLIMIMKQSIGQWALLPAFVMLGLTSMGAPVGSAIAKELNHAKVTATAIGFLNTVAYAVVAIMVSVSGHMLELFRESAVRTELSVVYPQKAYMCVLLMCTVMSAFSVFASCVIRETHGINVAANL